MAAPAPDHAIARGRAGAGLLAHILVAKYDDHLPLYRQAEIYAREGVDLETSTLSGWVGATAAALKPLVDALAAEVMAAETLHVDDTPVPVLAPGTGKTKTGRLWVYVRDERPFAGARPPAALYCYSADRKGEHPRTHLKAFSGVIQADGYAGFTGLFAGNRITEAACWAHVRRKFFDVHAATGSPIAKEALDRIGDLYKIDKTIAGLPPDVRRGQRQQRSKPIAEALAAWAETTLRRLSRKSELAKAFRYMRSRWKALLRCFDDGRLALDNNPAERALRCVAIGRKNYLFAGSDAGGHRAAAIYSLIETAKLNRRNPSTTSPTCWPASPIIRPGKSPISCPGTGRPPTFSAPPPDPAPSPSRYDLSYDRRAAGRSRCLAGRLQRGQIASRPLVLWQDPDADLS